MTVQEEARQNRIRDWERFYKQNTDPDEIQKAAVIEKAKERRVMKIKDTGLYETP